MTKSIKYTIISSTYAHINTRLALVKTWDFRSTSVIAHLHFLWENRAQPRTSRGLMTSKHLRITQCDFQPLKPAYMVIFFEHRNDFFVYDNSNTPWFHLQKWLAFRRRFFTRAAHVWTRTGMFCNNLLVQ